MAPLKLEVQATFPAQEPIFPRLKRRGPIEASVGVGVGLPLSSFPRLKRRGPIEANHGPVRGRLYRAFPRLKRRGPIEAGENPN